MTIEITDHDKCIRYCDVTVVPRTGDILENPAGDKVDYRVHAVRWSSRFDSAILDVLPVGVGREEPK